MKCPFCTNELTQYEKTNHYCELCKKYIYNTPFINLDTSLGSNIRQLREQHNETQEVLQELLHKSQKEISKIENNNKKYISLQTIQIIATYYNVKPDEIFYNHIDPICYIDTFRIHKEKLLQDIDICKKELLLNNITKQEKEEITNTISFYNNLINDGILVRQTLQKSNIIHRTHHLLLTNKKIDRYFEPITIYDVKMILDVYSIWNRKPEYELEYKEKQLKYKEDFKTLQLFEDWIFKFCKKYDPLQSNYYYDEKFLFYCFYGEELYKYIQKITNISKK